MKNKCLQKQRGMIHFETRSTCFSREAEEGNGRALATSVCMQPARRRACFCYFPSLEQGQAALSVWAELGPTHLNLFIFLGGSQRTGERQSVNLKNVFFL